jgi:hypothetical protein
MAYHKVFAICAGAILVAAPSIPAQQGEQGLEPVPYRFSHETLVDNPLLSSREHPAQHRAFTVPAKVWAGLSGRPRRSLEYRSRKAIAEYASQRNQWIRCELQNGRVLVGTCTYCTSDEFNLQYGAFGERRIKYAELIAVPRPVPATGEKLVRGLEIAGIVGLVVITAPITIPVLSLMCVSGQCVD